METVHLLPDITTLYRLPFSKNDNPNGWIEITTDCNLKCPGCYRGCDRNDNIPIHEPLVRIKENILKMKHLRNCQIISVSGGEPLMHPELPNIVRFIKDNGMYPFVHTNGVLLNPEKIRQLKEHGLAGLIIRIDSLMSRKRKATEEELNATRKRFGEMVYSVKGIHLTFLCVVNQDNIKEIANVIKWTIENSRLVDFITFIPMRQVLFEEGEVIDPSKWIYMEDLFKETKNAVPNIRYASYLGSKLEPAGIKWLQSPWIVLNKTILGYASPKFVESFQVFHHLFTGKYAYKFGKDRSYLNFLMVLLLSIVYKNFREVAANYFKAILENPANLFRRANLQLLCFIIPPGLVNGKRDECDGCPDAMLYEGQLVPSCGLEEYKLYGKILEKQESVKG
jgi:pyruvate-formate lyase-activating enzyme